MTATKTPNPLRELEEELAPLDTRQAELSRELAAAEAAAAAAEDALAEGTGTTAAATAARSQATALASALRKVTERRRPLDDRIGQLRQESAAEAERDDHIRQAIRLSKECRKDVDVFLLARQARAEAEREMGDALAKLRDHQRALYPHHTALVTALNVRRITLLEKLRKLGGDIEAANAQTSYGQQTTWGDVLAPTIKLY